MLEVINVAEITQTLQVANDELVVLLKGTELTQHEDGAVAQLPKFFRPAEAVVHAATATLKLGRERAATEQRVVAVTIVSVRVLLAILYFLLTCDAELGHILESRELLAVRLLLLGLQQVRLDVLTNLF